MINLLWILLLIFLMTSFMHITVTWLSDVARRLWAELMKPLPEEDGYDGEEIVPYAYVSRQGTIFYLYAEEKFHENGGARTYHHFRLEKMAGALEELPEGAFIKELPNGVPILSIPKALLCRRGIQ